MIDEKKLLNEMTDLLAKDCKDMELCGKIVGLISVQPTIQPHGHYKDKLIEEITKIADRYCDSIKCEMPCIEDETYICDHANMIGAILDFINQQPTTDGWIPVNERLPEELEPVNITWVNRKPESYYNEVKDVPFTATAVLCKGKWWWYSVYCEDYLAEYGKSLGDEMDKDIEVIAWQPLPPAYKESEDNG